MHVDPLTPFLSWGGFFKELFWWSETSEPLCWPRHPPACLGLNTPDKSTWRARLCPSLPGPGMGLRVNPSGDRQRKGPEALGGVLVRGWNLDSLSYLKRKETNIQTLLQSALDGEEQEEEWRRTDVTKGHNKCSDILVLASYVHTAAEYGCQSCLEY